MNSILSAPGRTHHQPVSAPSKMAWVTDETLKSLKTLFSKRSLLQTKQFIEDDILWNRAPQDMPLDTYKSIWYKTIDSIKLAEKTGDEDQRTEAALRKIANTIKEYCKNNEI